MEQNHRILQRYPELPDPRQLELCLFRYCEDYLIFEIVPHMNGTSRFVGQFYADTVLTGTFRHEGSWASSRHHVKPMLER